MDGPWSLLTGHVVDILRTMPVGSAHMVCTSPPYWGLRDYEMAVWEGGSDPSCSHRPHADLAKSMSTSTLTGGLLNTGAVASQQVRFRERCARCGALRVEPTVWDGDPGCEHEWGKTIPATTRDRQHLKELGERDGSGGGNKHSRGLQYGGTNGNFCVKCGAWRGALGLEPSPSLYVKHIADVMDEVRRVLRPDGTLWLNLGDTYAANGGWSDNHGLDGDRGGGRGNSGRGVTPNRRRVGGVPKPKDLVGIPWLAAFELQARGWWLRAAIVWAKPNAMPESTRDRPTRSYENVFLLSPSERYFYDREATLEPLKSTSLQRISQASFDLQQGWPKDYGLTGVNPNRSARKMVENLRDRVYKHDSHSRFGKRSPNRVWGDPESLERLLSGRNMRDVWFIPTKPFPGAHFAVMPEALVEPCVKSGTSSKGCCPECGAPWSRVVRRVKHPTRDPEAQRKSSVEQTGRADGKTPGPGGMVDTIEHGSWQPGCRHGLEPAPCTVLDPFVGSGTVGVVALKHGRRFIGIDVNPAYVRMAEGRLSGVDPLFQASGVLMTTAGEEAKG